VRIYLIHRNSPSCGRSYMTDVPSDPVGRLPSDLLREIFTLSLPTEPFADDDGASADPSITREPTETHQEEELKVLPPRNISGVCRHWRDVTLATPALWARWFLSLNNPTKNELRMATKFIRQCLSRSGDVPLAFYVSVDIWREKEVEREADELILLLLSTQRRWSKVFFCCNQPCFPNLDSTAECVDFICAAAALSQVCAEFGNPCPGLLRQRKRGIFPLRSSRGPPKKASTTPR